MAADVALIWSLAIPIWMVLRKHSGAHSGRYMPPPIKVELQAHDPNWSQLANVEAGLLLGAIGPSLMTVYHVGSTAIAGIRAKPILDLIPVVESLFELDSRQGAIEALGYEWWGELGLPGRRYCTKADRESGRRTVQLHCYSVGSREIMRHLAFRDYLRAHATLAAEYDQLKARCQRAHPDNSHAYGDCKDELPPIEWTPVVGSESQEVSNGRSSTSFILGRL